MGIYFISISCWREPVIANPRASTFSEDSKFPRELENSWKPLGEGDEKDSLTVFLNTIWRSQTSCGAILYSFYSLHVYFDDRFSLRQKIQISLELTNSSVAESVWFQLKFLSNSRWIFEEKVANYSCATVDFGWAREFEQGKVNSTSFSYQFSFYRRWVETCKWNFAKIGRKTSQTALSRSFSSLKILIDSNE